MRLYSLAAIFLLFASPSSAQQDTTPSDKTIRTTVEKRIHDICVQENGDRFLCGCIQAETREKMPVSDYHFILEAIYHTENLDMDSLKKTLDKYAVDQARFTVLLEKLTAIENAAEERCETISEQVNQP